MTSLLPPPRTFHTKPLRTIEELKTEIQQYQRERLVPREMTSTTTTDLIKYIREHQTQDPLLNGVASRSGPFAERKKTCTLL